LPKYAGIHKASGQLMKDWKKLVDDDERAVEAVLNPPSKRHVVTVSALIRLGDSANGRLTPPTSRTSPARTATALSER
jgi:hypothetical protein